MFGKKKNKKKNEEKKYDDLSIISMPDIFYGGQDPDIYHNYETEKKDKQDKKEPEKKKVVVKKPVKTTQKKGNAKLWWIYSIIIFVLAVAGISWYYLKDYFVTQNTLVEQNNQNFQNTTKNNETNIGNNTNTVVSSTDQLVTSTIKTETTTSTTALDNVFLEFLPILTTDASDIDADSLTDIEEEIFDTDSGTWDSDGDNYYDGQEVYNLYNPKGQAPVRLIDSGLVKEYQNPITGYRLYYPLSWQRGSVDIQESQVLFSASTGEYVEVRFFAKTPGQQFVSWFSRYAEGQNYNDLSSFTNRFSEEAFIRKDSLVAYFEDESYVYVMIYHTDDRGPVVFRHIMQMMYQSFRIQKTNTSLPEQTVFPDVNMDIESNTTTSTVTSSVEIIFPDSTSTTENI